MLRLILFSLFLSAVNCQLAYIWLNYHHFQCAQNTRNYREFIQHQYLCTSSVIRTCIYDNIAYTQSPVISLNYFCGFIDGRNALQPHTIWNIHIKPNIKIQFLKFVLSHNYWYCDYEFLRVYSNTSKISTFCGNRLPWSYDASNTRLKIMLVTHHSGWENYQVELLYYGAYVPAKNQHFVIFTQQSSMISTHYPNTEQNEFEGFHFISSSRLNILQLEAMNICSKEQIVCYDGPGIKSPILQFTYNQSEWKCLSSTFQMVCKFTRATICTKVPYLRYHSMRARYYQVEFGIATYIDIDINRTGTTKYIYYNQERTGDFHFMPEWINLNLPFMLYEGNSCMYGGVYVVKTLSSKDVELFSFCTPATFNVSERNSIPIIFHDLYNFSVVIIHYSEYSPRRLKFHAEYSFYNQLIYSLNTTELTLVNQQYVSNAAIDITVPTLGRDAQVIIKSYLLKLRKVQYINISLNNEGTLVKIMLNKLLRTACIDVTIFYSLHLSNIRGRQNYQETRNWNESVLRLEFVKPVFMNMTSCDFWNVPVWKFYISTYIYGLDLSALNTSRHMFIPTFTMCDVEMLEYFPHRPFWFMVHFVRPDEIPLYAIYRVIIHVDNTGSRVSKEVPTDNYQSSSVYGWNRFNGDVYIVINKTLNILFESNNSMTRAPREVWTALAEDHYNITYHFVFSMHFMRHIIYDEKITKNLAGQASEQSDFTFHNQR